MPTTKRQSDGTLFKALAPAWRWQRMLDDGVYASVSEIGDAENISKSYVSRILRLALLAPDIVERIVEGRADPALMLERLERPLPVSWAEQRQAFLVTTLIAEGVRSRPSLDPAAMEDALKGFFLKVMPSKFEPRSRAWA